MESIQWLTSWSQSLNRLRSACQLCVIRIHSRASSVGSIALSIQQSVYHSKQNIYVREKKKKWTEPRKWTLMLYIEHWVSLNTIFFMRNSGFENFILLLSFQIEFSVSFYGKTESKPSTIHSLFLLGAVPLLIYRIILPEKVRHLFYSWKRCQENLMSPKKGRKRNERWEEA